MLQFTPFAALLVSPLAQEDATGLFAGLGGLMIVFWVFALLLTAFWIWMLVDCLTSAMPTNEKILWALVMLIVPLIGSILYFFVKRSPRVHAPAVSTGTLGHA